ncbi:MAG TPA: hypothetical protein VFO25_13990 [Candidatus Eremiobacteraceae bacterium]|nr:hypothetical protein [Candidatus Eremiobacteraceae bacterium]
MGQRGFLLVYALVIVSILALVATLVLASADQAASDARQTEVKNESFDASEAGLNAALDALDTSLLNTGSRSATLSNGFKYTYAIYPNLLGGQPQTITDPAQGLLNSVLTTLGGLLQTLSQPQGGNTIAIPALGAVIVSVGTGPRGERPTVLEAAVTVEIGSLSYPHYAALTGLNIQGSYQAPFATGGGNAITLHANESIRADVPAAFQGRAEAGGETNTIPPGTTHASMISLPMVSQFDYMVASMKNQAQSGANPDDFYQTKGSALDPTYTCGASHSCVLFYDGPLKVTSGQTTFTGLWTVIVNGNLTVNGGAGLNFQSRPSELVVNGTAIIDGNGATAAYLEVKGGTKLAGDSTFTGAIMTLGTLTFDGGDSGSFTYDPTVIPPVRPLAGLVKVISYAEY